VGAEPEVPEALDPALVSVVPAPSHTLAAVVPVLAKSPKATNATMAISRVYSVRS